MKNLDNNEDVEINEFKLHYRGESMEPLRPEHIREAVRLYKLESSGGYGRNGEDKGKEMVGCLGEKVLGVCGSF